MPHCCMSTSPVCIVWVGSIWRIQLDSWSELYYSIINTMIWNERFGAAFLRDFALCVIMQLSEYHSSLSLSLPLSFCLSVSLCLCVCFSLFPLFVPSFYLLWYFYIFQNLFTTMFNLLIYLNTHSLSFSHSCYKH